MHPKGPSAAILLVMIFLTAGLLVGCGGGDQSGSGSQQDEKAAPEKQDENAPEKKQAKNAPEKKTVLGTVAFVNPETEGFSVRPSTDQQGKKPVVFRLAYETKITLDGKEAKLEDMEKGQQAQVEYVVRNDRNRARSVKLFEGEDDPSKDGGTPPENGDDSTGDQGSEKTG